MSLLDSRDLVLAIRPVDLTTVMEVALAAACRRGELPAVELDAAPGLRVLGDARRLEQVVANLIENALAHGGAPVSVRASILADGNVEVSVRDHGEGVPTEVEPTLFSQLQTFSRSDRDRGRGTGLGLALVRGLVEAMGGRVSHERPPDGGACFRLVLPPAPSVRG